MSRIDKVRLASIFRTLSSTSKPAPRKEYSHDDKSVHFSEEAISLSRQSELKSNMKRRLAALKKESKNFEKEAPMIAVEEVLLWEFGTEILSDPNFKRISEKISESINQTPALQKHLVGMIDQLEL